jgi:hypothetical protein
MSSELIDRYGYPDRINTAGMLRVLGLRGEIHPRDAFACRYPSMEAASAFARSNRERNGLAVHGPFETEVGPIALVDLRPALLRIGGKLTDPALPDELPKGPRKPV